MGEGAAGEENRGEAARPATVPPPRVEEDKNPTYPSIITPPIDPNLLPDNFPWPYFKYVYSSEKYFEEEWEETIC